MEISKIGHYEKDATYLIIAFGTEGVAQSCIISEANETRSHYEWLKSIYNSVTEEDMYRNYVIGEFKDYITYLKFPIGMSVDKQIDYTRTIWHRVREWFNIPYEINLRGLPYNKK